MIKKGLFIVVIAILIAVIGMILWLFIPKLNELNEYKKQAEFQLAKEKKDNTELDDKNKKLQIDAHTAEVKFESVKKDEKSVKDKTVYETKIESNKKEYHKNYQRINDADHNEKARIYAGYLDDTDTYEPEDSDISKSKSTGDSTRIRK